MFDKTSMGVIITDDDEQILEDTTAGSYEYTIICLNCHPNYLENDEDIVGDFIKNGLCSKCGKHHYIKYNVNSFDWVTMKLHPCYYPGYRHQMAKLKLENEFQYRMIVAQEKNKRESGPRCNACGSEDLTRISSVSKAAKIGFFGIFGAGDLGKTYKCNNCGCKF